MHELYDNRSSVSLLALAECRCVTCVYVCSYLITSTASLLTPTAAMEQSQPPMVSQVILEDCVYLYTKMPFKVIAKHIYAS
jgi:hypothetical protein